MKDLNSFGWYAARVSSHLPEEAFKPVPTRLLGGLAYLIIVLSGFFAVTLIDLHLLVKIAISIVLGSSFAALGFLGHEILHGTVVRHAVLRDLLGAIAFFPLTTGPQLWRKWHNMTHHIHTQNDELDPDAWFTLEQLSKYPFLQLIYRLPHNLRAFVSFISLSISFTLHSSRMFGRFIKEFHPKKQPKVWLQLFIPWTAWIGLLFGIGWEKWFFVYLLPLLIANFIVMGYISTNHRLNPIVPVNDPLANSLTVTVPRWVDVLHFNFSYHTEHHLFPGMSPKYYPLVKEKLLQMWPNRYHQMSLIRALITLWKTPRIYYRNNELIDPHEEHLYGSLGNGLDPQNVTHRTLEQYEKSNAS